MLNEKEIVEGCLKGNPLAQEQLYKRFASKMYGVCLRYSCNHMEAEDTLHEGFMKVYQHIDRFGFKGSFEGWVRRIMINTALKKFHHDKNLHLRQNPLDEVYEHAEEYHPTGVDRLSAEEMMQMVQKLAPGFRMVFNLYAVEGYSHQEISDMLNITISTSKSQLSRARLILQKMLGFTKEEVNV